MTIHRSLGNSALGLALLVNATLAAGGLTDLSDAPLATSVSTPVLPNIMYLLDDSGSMAWPFMPDWAGDSTSKYQCESSAIGGSATGPNPPHLCRNAAFNGLAYNPATTYTPPVFYNSDGTVNTTSYPSMTGTSTATGGSTAAAFPNWKAVKFDGFNIQVASGSGPGYCPDGTTGSSGKCDLTNSAYFYTLVPGEYCTDATLKTCIAATTPSGSYTSAATRRWCTTSADATAAATASPTTNSCQALRLEPTTTTKTYLRFPTASLAKFTISGASTSSNATISGITVNGKQIMAASATVLASSSTAAATLAQAVADQINTCTFTTSATPACEVTGYAAYVTLSSSVYTVNIVSPTNSAISSTNVILSRSGGSLTFSGLTGSASPYTVTSGFALTPTSTAAAYRTQYGSYVYVPVPSSAPGSNLLTVITPVNNSYPYPGTTAKASSRTDCAGTTCTYAEEMTNFANWLAYYHTRMQMTKTAISIAFSPIGDSYRLGYMTIDNNNGSDFLNILPFTGANKSAWYTKMFATKPGNSTPLRTALATVGNLYKGSTSKVNGVTPTDPMQYSCQQNFTIMSTDGYWNDSTAPTVGNPDGSSPGSSSLSNIGTEVRPMVDGLNISNTLADVAEWYYGTDLRTTCTTLDVCTNNVSGSSIDNAKWQHMTTFTLGLGASGYMQFSPTYQSDTTGDYSYVKKDTDADPSNGICSWGTSGSKCSWPKPVSNSQTTIDDLWHAAVNGRGSYYSATDPVSLSVGLDSALAAINADVGATGAASISNPNVSTNDNYVFSTSFTTVEWSGEVVRRVLNLTTGAVATTNDWSAQTLLDQQDYSSRPIYMYDSGVGTHLKLFQWPNLTSSGGPCGSGGEQACFTLPNIASLSQLCPTGYGCLDASVQASVPGENLVNFLRGERANEGLASAIKKYFRQRAHILGDIVDAETVYVREPTNDYSDDGYGEFTTLWSSRTAVVYAAANDGMLHAFDATTGAELWGYIPTAVLPNLYRLADKNYSKVSKHRYFVDGTPAVGDICPKAPGGTCSASEWKTILVGGLGKGGRGFYALDITNPAAPKALWEFNYSSSPGDVRNNLGYSYGNPVITKLEDGTWVVLVTSGYNNVPESGTAYTTGDGNGHLYVLNAATGALVTTVNGTGVIDTKTVGGTVAGSYAGTVPGCTATPCPNGLARISTWVTPGKNDNTAQRVYGGDLFGNLWRFDINDNVGAPGYEAQQLATLKDASGNAQPVTARPELGDVNGVAVVFVGTGRFLGASASPVNDINDTSQQSFYAVKDRLDSVGNPSGYNNPADSFLGNPRTNNFVQQTLTQGACPATSATQKICTTGVAVNTVTSNAVNLFTQNGWFLDFPEVGERASTDPALAFGTLVFNTNVPESRACIVGGHSNRYFLNYRTGGALLRSPDKVGSTRLQDNSTGTGPGIDALASRPVLVSLNNKILTLIQLSNGATTAPPLLIDTGTARRAAWRELID